MSNGTSSTAVLEVRLDLDRMVQDWLTHLFRSGLPLAICLGFLLAFDHLPHLALRVGKTCFLFWAWHFLNYLDNRSIALGEHFDIISAVSY